MIFKVPTKPSHSTIQWKFTVCTTKVVSCPSYLEFYSFPVLLFVPGPLTHQQKHTEVFRHFAVVPSDRTRDSAETWEVPSENQETLFRCEGDQALHRLLRQMVEFPSSQVFKSCLDIVLGKWLLMVMLRAEVFNWMLSRDPFQFQLDCDSG